MFDHVGLAVSDLEATREFYGRLLAVLGLEPSYEDSAMIGWDDLWIGTTDATHPVTTGLHIGLRAPNRETVDSFWQTGIDAGYRDAGAPGPRTTYRDDYYGGFLLDPDGNSIEAVHYAREPAVPDGRIDHLWLRVRDPQVSRRFYATIAPHARLALGRDLPEHVSFTGPDFSIAMVRDGRPPTEHLHIAFTATADETVRDFHVAATAAGYTDNGEPGERAVYHRGYYAAFVIDPDGCNVEVVNHNQ